MKITRYIDKFLVFGILTSFLLSLILYFSKVDTVSSLIVGLLGTILTLQIDLIARVEKSSERHNEMLDLAYKIEKSSNFGRLLSGIIEYTFQIESNKIHKAFLKRMTLEMEQFKEFVIELSKGHLHTGQNENDLIMQLINQAKSQMVVLSLSITSANDFWWDTPMGKKFWEVNLEAIRRNVEIVRIFVFSEQNPEREEIMKEQFLNGVKVYWIRLGEIPLELQVSMAVFDDKVGYQLVQTIDGQVSGYLFTTDEGDVRKMKRIYERVVFMAHLYLPQESNSSASLA